MGPPLHSRHCVGDGRRRCCGGGARVGNIPSDCGTDPEVVVGRQRRQLAHEKNVRTAAAPMIHEHNTKSQVLLQKRPSCRLGTKRHQQASMHACMHRHLGEHKKTTPCLTTRIGVLPPQGFCCSEQDNARYKRDPRTCCGRTSSNSPSTVCNFDLKPSTSWWSSCSRSSH